MCDNGNVSSNPGKDLAELDSLIASIFTLLGRQPKRGIIGKAIARHETRENAKERNYATN